MSEEEEEEEAELRKSRRSSRSCCCRREVVVEVEQSCIEEDKKKKFSSTRTDRQTDVKEALFRASSSSSRSSALENHSLPLPRQPTDSLLDSNSRSGSLGCVKWKKQKKKKK